MTTSARARLGLAAVAAVSLIAGGSLAASAATPAAAAPGEGAGFKTRAVKALVASSAKARTRTRTIEQPAPSSKSRSAAEESVPESDRPAGAPDTAPQRLSAAAAADCASLNFDWTPTYDHVWLHWDSTGAASYAIQRQRVDGAWKQIGTSTGTSFLDKTINPRGLTDYRIVAGGLTCELSDFVSMSTADGNGIPDAVYGGASTTGQGTGQLMEQDVYSYAMATGINGSDPAFSPDGRRVAVATQDAQGVWRLDIRDLSRPGTGIVAFNMPLNTVPADPAWSPDGRLIAFTAYTVDPDTGDVTGSELHVFAPYGGQGGGSVSGSAGLIQPDWRSASTLVAAGLGTGEGLFTMPAAGGTRAPIAGTANAGYPEVGPDGRTWYVEGDGTNFSLRVMDAQGGITIWESSTTSWFELPRTTPDNTVYVVQIDRNDPTDPADNTFTVKNAGSNEVSAIGAPRDESLVGFSGFDVRQPKSKGTSDYVGDGNPEILGKDSAGKLWAYYGSDVSPVAGRTSMGGGWNMFNQIVAPGDLDGDDKADVLARKPDGTLWLYHGLGKGKVQAGVQVGSGWSSYVLVAPGDFNGDGVADLLGRDSKFQLWLYPGNGNGTFGVRTLVTSGWGGFSAIIGFGDFNFDGKADILGRERSTGYMYLYPGTGTGGITGRTKLGAGWNSLNAFAAPEFYGITPGLFGRWADGSMRYYQVTGDGRFDSTAVYPAGGGWGSYQITG